MLVVAVAVSCWTEPWASGRGAPRRSERRQGVGVLQPTGSRGRHRGRKHAHHVSPPFERGGNFVFVQKGSERSGFIWILMESMMWHSDPLQLKRITEPGIFCEGPQNQTISKQRKRKR